MINPTIAYARKICTQLLNLQPGEDLCINSEQRSLYFAKTVKDEALYLTHRPVTFVITQSGHPSGLAPYDPEDYILPKSRGRVMLHLQAPKRPSIITDFEEASENLGLMMDLGHLSDPVILDRRIAVPWCSVMIPDEDDSILWDEITSSFLFKDDEIHQKHKSRCDSLNNFGITSLILKGNNTDLKLEIDPSSRFTGNHFILDTSRSFFSGLRSDYLSVNLKRSNCSGNADVKALIMGNALETEIRIDSGMVILDPMNYQQRLLKRFFLLEDNLDCLSQVTLSEDEVILTLGPDSVESLKTPPTNEKQLPSWFLSNEFNLKLSVSCNTVEALTSSSEHLLLRNGDNLLI